MIAENKEFKRITRARDVMKIIEVFIPYLPLLPKINVKILFIEIIAISIDKMVPANIIQRPIVERSLKNIQTINPKINDEIEASRSPCLNDLILFLISVNNLLKLNFVESIEGLLSLLVLILSPPS